MQERQANKPVKLNLDISRKYLPLDTAFYLLNNERNIVSKGVIGKNTPMPSNYVACEMEEMTGDPNSVGSYRDPNTNEVYSWTMVDGGINYVLRINPDGSCEVVYSGDNDCLPLSADPKHAIRQWRAYLKYDKLCAHRHGKALIWTDGLNDIGMIDTEASIATNNFTTPFFDICPDPCAFTKMCVPLYCKQLVGEWVPLDISDIDLTNHLMDVAVQVCFRHIYYDGRVSEWMGVSSTYYQDSKSCFDTSEGFPRCLKFRVPVGNPMVDRIEFAVRRDNEIFTDSLSPLWRSVEVVEKYKPYATQDQMWYEREMEDLLNFSEDDCCFDYIFCNDKECNPINPDETNRVYNPMPIQPQGIIRVKDSLGFYNYRRGTCPISEEETKKFTIGLQCRDGICNSDLVDVTIYSIVYNREDSNNAFIFRFGGINEDDPDDPNDMALFGRASIDLTPYDQYFRKKTRNFIAYIEGTDYWAEMEQWESEPYFVNTKKKGVIAGFGQQSIVNAVLGRIDSGYFYFQKAVIKVPKGTRGFVRIASQQAIDGLGNNQDTSTFVLGTIADINGYNGAMNLDGLISGSKEIYIDTCSGPVTINETFVINDNFKRFHTGYHTASAYCGYITDANNNPVEGAQIWDVLDGSFKCVTDHNGFYHFHRYGGENRTIYIEVYVERGCVGGFTMVKSIAITSGYFLAQVNAQISDTDAPGYKTDFYQQVNVYVRDCDNQPVPGIRVAMSGSKYAVTDISSGAAVFKLRNYSTRDRVAKAVVLNHNGCFSLDCNNNCNPCSPVTSDTPLSACFSGRPYLDIMPTTKLNRDTGDDAKRGLKAGGRYPFGVVVKWPCNKISSVYPVTILSGSLPQKDNYLDIPKTQEKDLLSFCNIEFNGNGITLPQGASCLSIVRGENVNRFELQWVIDEIERTPERKIKLTIQSLNDYNSSYNFKTNTVYEYKKNDRVEFIANGDGTIFDTATFGLLNYLILSPFHDKIVSGQDDAPANYFNQILIDDDGKLEDLKVGAKIEIQRPRDCTVEPTYFEVFSIPLVEISGQTTLATPTGTFNTFDTFFVNRKIGKNAEQIFEHHSPSDFWGNRINDGGKVHFVNRFENEQRFGRNISFNSATHYNIFGYLEKTFDSPEQGDITAMFLYDNKQGLAIAENDNFTFQVADDFLRVGGDGIVRASSPDSVIGDANPKIAGIFGCQYPHIGSIYFGDGYVTYWDVNKSAYVKHDFNIARDISEGKAKLYFDKRGQFIETFNKTAATDREKFRIVTGYNTLTKAVMITVKSLVQGGTYNHYEAFGQTNDTILFHPGTEDFLTFAGFVPEEYSNLDLYDGFGCAFLCFLNGIPYIHPKIALSDNDYNEFFGVPTDWVAGVAINTPQEKIKIPVAMEVVSEDMWFLKKVVTDKEGFESEVPPIRFKKKERKWNASFLFDKNSRGGLYGTDKRVAGTPARGYHIDCTFVRDNTDNLIYNSVNASKMTKFGELDMFLFKSAISEQSGFTENV